MLCTPFQNYMTASEMKDRISLEVPNKKMLTGLGSLTKIAAAPYLVHKTWVDK